MTVLDEDGFRALLAGRRPRGVSAAVDAASVRAIHERLRARDAAFVTLLGDLVAIDSGTGDAEGIARVAARIARELADLGFVTEAGGLDVGAAPAVTADPGASPTDPEAGALVARSAGPYPGPRVLVVGHLDTVFPAGEAARRPFGVADARATGPGVADMKGGLALLLHALAATRDVLGVAVPRGELVVVLSPDEETGSPVGSAAIRAEAAGAAAALVLEPARPDGELVVARKGMLQARLVASGRAAHAGVDPDRGRSAVLALAHATVALHALADPTTGVTCTVGTLHGGDRPNVVPAAAILEVDLRAPTPATMAAAEAALAIIVAEPAVPDVTIRLEPLGRFSPMPETPGSRTFLALAAATGKVVGVEVRAVATGGASDANGIAEMGVAVLDGLGPVGGHAHAPGEYVDLHSIPERAALLAGLLLALGRGGPAPTD